MEIQMMLMTTLSPNLISLFTLSQEYCKLVGGYRKIIRWQLWKFTAKNWISGGALASSRIILLRAGCWHQWLSSSGINHPQVFDDQLKMFCHLYYFEQSVSILLWCVVLGCWVLKRQSQAGFSDWVLQHTHSEPEHWQKDGRFLIWFERFQLIKEILGVIWYQIEPFWVVLIVCQHRLTTGKIGVALGGCCRGTAWALSGHCTTTRILIT